MQEAVAQPDGTVRLRLLGRLPLRGGIDGHQAAFQGKIDHQVSGAEIALDEHAVAGAGVVQQPVPDGLEVSAQLGQVRRNVPPECPQGFGGLDHPGYAQAPTGVLFLVRCQVVIEKQNEGAFHGTIPCSEGCRD